MKKTKKKSTGGKKTPKLGVIKPSDDMIHLSDAMKMTGYAQGTFYRYLHTGKITAFKVGRKTYFKRKDLEALMTPVAISFSKSIKAAKKAAGKGAAKTKRPKPAKGKKSTPAKRPSRAPKARGKKSAEAATPATTEAAS